MLFLAVVLCALVAVSHGNERIVGGTNAVYGEHPYICSLQTTSGFHFCGAVIWNNNYVVTAAHCLSGSASSIRVVCGNHRISQTDSHQVTHVAASYTRHPNYNGNAAGYPNDIAVIRLTSPLTFNSHVDKGTFASSGSFVGQSCILSGWGRLVGGGATANTLQRVNMGKISNTDCANRWSGISGASINSGHICFFQGSGYSACNGDSGGPVRCGNTITGITSWGISTCSGSYPSVYTRVSTFYSWLVTTAGGQ